MKKAIVFCLLGIAAAAPVCGFTLAGKYNGTTNYVSKSGSDANDGKSWATAKKTIQAAVNLCVAGDTVIVDDGEYSDTTAWTITNSGTTYNNPVVVKITKRIHLVSRNGKAKTHIVGQWANTLSGIANDGTAHRCIYIANVADVLIEGFTIRDGATAGGGAGNNNFDSAGGVCGGTGSSNCYLVDCDVVNCRAGLGAALSRGIVPIRCAFVGNRGVTATSTSHVFYRTDAAYNCLFVANGPASGRAGCIFAIVQSSTVVNCTFLNNTCYGFAPNNTSNKHLVWNCAFLGNGEQATATSTANDVIVYTTNCVQTATGGRIATEGEPAHCQVGVSPIQYFWSPDSASCSFVEDNVLRDAGGDAGRDVAARFVPEEYLDTDFAGNPRVVGAHMDIGAIEATGEARAPATGVMTIGANVAVQTNGVACTIPTGYPFAFESFPGQVRLAPDFPVATPFFGFVIRGGWSLCRFPDLGADGGAWFTPPPAGVAISITARPAEGEKWVQADYAGGDSDGSPDKPYTTITAASAASKDYGLIHVRKGVYDTGSSLLDGHTWPARVAIDRSIAVRSVDGAAETFIVGDDATRCVAVRSWGYDVHFQGFTITGGTADGADANALRGGGFWVTAHSWANATGLTLNGNSSHVTDCVFSNNVAREAGAMVGGWAQRCVFTGNRIGTTYADRGAVAYGTVLSACVVTNNNDTHTSSICALYHCAPHNVTFAESNKVVGTSTDYRPVDMNTPAFNCAFLGGYLDNASTGVLSPAGNVGASLGALVSRPWITLYGRDSLFVDAAAGDLRLRPEFGATRDGDGTVHNAALFAVGDFEGNALKYVDGNPVPGAYSDVEILPPRDLYVDAVNGDDANDGLTSATAKQTLAAILSITRKYDTVHAARGDYNSGSETYDKAIYRADPDGKGYSPARGIVRTKVTLVADEGPDVTSITGVIGTGNGNNLGDDAVRCLTMLPNSALRGFTLRNGSTFHVTGAVLDNNVGGCILAPSCANGISGSALIENCVISNGFGRNAGCVMGGILRRCTLAHGGATSGAAISMNSRFEHCFILNNRADTGVRDCGGMSSTTYISLGESSHPSNGELTGAHSGARFENSILITKNHAASDGSHPTNLKNVRNCIWAVGGDRTQIDPATSANVITGTLQTAMLDAAHGYRPLAGSPVINAGDQTLLASLAGDATTDYAGIQRVYDGEVDIGAYEYDIRPAMAALLYKNATVTAAAPAARIVGGTISLPSGEVTATFAFPSTARFLVPVQVTGTGTFSIYVGNAAVPIATATSASGATELKLSVPAGETARFVYEPGANDTGAAILGALANASGMTVIFR